MIAGNKKRLIFNPDELYNIYTILIKGTVFLLFNAITHTFSYNGLKDYKLQIGWAKD